MAKPKVLTEGENLRANKLEANGLPYSAQKRAFSSNGRFLNRPYYPSGSATPIRLSQRAPKPSHPRGLPGTANPTCRTESGRRTDESTLNAKCGKPHIIIGNRAKALL